MSEAFEPAAFLGEFLAEALEHLAVLDDELLRLERVVKAGRPVPEELINGLFRAIHTIKGMAGMMGFSAFTELAHALEQTFDGVRYGTRLLAPADMGLLFDGLDALKRLHAHVGTHGSEAGLDVADTLAALRGPAAMRPGGDLLDRIDPYEQVAVLVDVAKGAHLYNLGVIAARDLGDTPLAAWHEGLGLIGRVLGMWDAAGSPVADPAAHPRDAELVVLLLTEADRESVRDCSGVPEHALVDTPLPWKAARPEQAPEEAKAAPAAPAAPSIRVEAERLDRLMDLVGELVIHHTRLARLSAELSHLAEAHEAVRGVAQGLEETMQGLARVSDALQEGTMKVRMTPVGALFNRFARNVRDLASSCGKAARLEVLGGDTELDKNMIEQLADPLLHLLRNAVDHGLEASAWRLAAGKPAEGVVTLAASQRGQHVVIELADDGAGIDRAKVLAKARERGLVGPHEQPADAEVLQLIFKPGFSTAEAVTAISGRGVGMDVVLQNIQRLGGSVQVESRAGLGTRFTVRLPLTLMITKALLVQAAAQTFAIPLAAVEETLRPRRSAWKTLHGREVVQVRDRVVPVFRLGSLFAAAQPAALDPPMVVVGDEEQRLGLVVDGLVGQQDIVIKGLGDYVGSLPGIGGATILGDGRVALILDVPTLLQAA